MPIHPAEDAERGARRRLKADIALASERSARTLRLTTQESRALRHFVDAPMERHMPHDWPLRGHSAAGVSAYSAAIEQLQARRYAVRQVRSHAYRAPDEPEKLTIRASNLFPAVRRRGVFPPAVRLDGDVMTDMLWPGSPLPHHLHIRGSLTLSAQAHADLLPLELPRGLIVTGNLTLDCRAQGSSFVIGRNTTVGGNSTRSGASAPTRTP